MAGLATGVMAVAVLAFGLTSFLEYFNGKFSMFL
jgi:hypothetical protein